jgi:hypothetical protein
VFSLDAVVATGRLQEARRIAEAHDEVTRSLTSHHRMHAVGLLLGVAQAAGNWTRVRELTSRAEAAVAANIATPCISNASSLLRCALANVRLLDDREARRLERKSADLGMEGYGLWLDPLRLEIAMGRGALAEVERLLGETGAPGLDDPDGIIARLNALVVLGRRAQIEDEAPAALKPSSYLEPFALRALGFAHDDEKLISQAIQRFEAMGMEWHAAETKKLLT